jgi:hypothetical protein
MNRYTDSEIMSALAQSLLTVFITQETPKAFPLGEDEEKQD